MTYYLGIGTPAAPKMSITYRITNDGGDYMPSRSWHVEANVGNGWSRCAVCETRENAVKYILAQNEIHAPEDAMGLGCSN